MASTQLQSRVIPVSIDLTSLMSIYITNEDDARSSGGVIGEGGGGKGEGVEQALREKDNLL